jgi:hypothetical protein
MNPRVIGAAAASLVVLAACSTSDTSDPSESSDLRALEAGVDIDQPILQDFPAAPNPPSAFASVASWSLDYVALRDPNNPSNPDPTDPFNGFFLIGNDAGGTPLFFDAIALTDEGVGHFLFSFQTDQAGSYLQIPLVATTDDAAATAIVNATVGWLMSEKTRVGLAIQSEFATDTGADASTLTTQDLTTWKEGLQCVADLAVMGLTITDPVAFFASEAAVDGTFAVVSAVTGTGGTGSDVAGTVTNATLAGVAKGVGNAVKNAVTSGSIGEGTGTLLKSGTGALGAVAVAGAVGYQVYKNGVGAGLATAIKLVVPQACVAAYENITQVPHVVVAGGTDASTGACVASTDCMGALPGNTEACSDGTSAGAQWTCTSGACIISYCADNGGIATGTGDASADGGGSYDGGGVSSDGGDSFDGGEASNDGS